MNLRRIKHTLLRMNAEEKVIGGSALVILLSVFMPWYSVVMNFDKKSMTETGLSGDLGVVGFIIFLMAIISIIVLVGENMRLPLPRFGYKREHILLSDPDNNRHLYQKRAGFYGCQPTLRSLCSPDSFLFRSSVCLRPDSER